NHNNLFLIGLLNIIRCFNQLIILILQFIIACFFNYIAYKSTKYAGLTSQSKNLVLNETFKIVFIIIVLFIVIIMILYMFLWYFTIIFQNNNNNNYTFYKPYDSIQNRIIWLFMEICGFFLILYLTRLRKPQSNEEE